MLSGMISFGVFSQVPSQAPPVDVMPSTDLVTGFIVLSGVEAVQMQGAGLYRVWLCSHQSDGGGQLAPGSSSLVVMFASTFGHLSGRPFVVDRDYVVDILRVLKLSIVAVVWAW